MADLAWTIQDLDNRDPEENLPPMEGFLGGTTPARTSTATSAPREPTLAGQLDVVSAWT